MAKKKGSSPSGKPGLAKLRRLHKLSLATAKLSVEVFGDTLAGYSVPTPPKPKKSGAMILMASSVPPPPKPKLEALEDIVEGALSIAQGVEALASQDSES